ncbi:MAG: TlpA family protein disulfide reductase [Muribaculaceae bacterium]|nr:TlpA family protein disulfide reductase [Muribaculaceae bacterium]
MENQKPSRLIYPLISSILHPLLFLLPILLSSLLLLTISSCVSEEPQPDPLEVGDSCPRFSILTDAGLTLSMPDSDGRYSVIIFFNTECPDCRKELPVIQNVYDEINRQDIPATLIAISRNQSEEEVASYWRHNNLSIPFSAQTDTKIYNLFAASIIPRIYIANPDGIITHIWTDTPLPTSAQILAALR